MLSMSLSTLGVVSMKPHSSQHKLLPRAAVLHMAATREYDIYWNPLAEVELPVDANHSGLRLVMLAMLG